MCHCGSLGLWDFPPLIGWKNSEAWLNLFMGLMGVINLYRQNKFTSGWFLWKCVYLDFLFQLKFCVNMQCSCSTWHLQITGISIITSWRGPSLLKLVGWNTSRYCMLLQIFFANIHILHYYIFCVICVYIQIFENFLMLFC